MQTLLHRTKSYLGSFGFKISICQPFGVWRHRMSCSRSISGVTGWMPLSPWTFNNWVSKIKIHKKLKFWKGLRLGLIVRLIKMTMLYRSGVMLWKTELYKKEPHLKVLKYLNPNWSQITPSLQNLPRFSILDRIIRLFRGFIVWTLNRP